MEAHLDVVRVLQAKIDKFEAAALLGNIQPLNNSNEQKDSLSLDPKIGIRCGEYHFHPNLICRQALKLGNRKRDK